MTLHGLPRCICSPWRQYLRKDIGMLDMGVATSEMERRYELALEDMQTARLLAAFATGRLPAHLNRLLQAVRDLLVSLGAWLRVEHRLGSSSS